MIEKKIKALGLELPPPSAPGGNYTSLNIRGDIAFIAIQFPIQNGVKRFQGRLGEALDTLQGYQAMQLCALNLLAQIHKHIPAGQLEGINHIEAYYQGTSGWDDAPAVVDGASDLLNEVLEERGIHSRSILGVAALPRNFAVGLSASLTLARKKSWL